MSLETFIQNGKVVVGIVITTASMAVGGVTAWLTTVNRVDKAADRAEVAATAAQKASSDVGALRTETQEQIRKYQDTVDARLEEQKRQRQEDRQDIVLIKEQLRAQSATIDRMDRRQEVMLDRLNPPRRVVRDFPQ